MADRFPSLDDFDEAQPTVQDAGEPSTDDFLARERALLGDDAQQFSSNNDNLLGDDSVAGQQAHFETQFPDIISNAQQPAPPANVGGGPSVSYNSGFGGQTEEEPEVIKEWRAKRDADNAARAEKLAQQKGETIQEAQENIDAFYENYNTKKEKTIAQTRKDAEKFVSSRNDTTSGGTSWERISKLVDVSGKGQKGGASGSGKERFREMLTSLRKDEKAPGASGI